MKKYVIVLCICLIRNLCVAQYSRETLISDSVSWDMGEWKSSYAKLIVHWEGKRLEEVWIKENGKEEFLILKEDNGGRVSHYYTNCNQYYAKTGNSTTLYIGFCTSNVQQEWRTIFTIWLGDFRDEYTSVRYLIRNDQ